MKTLYFECFSGISGDMTLGALLDLGIDQNQFLKELNKLSVEGFSVQIRKTIKNGIQALDVNVCLDEPCHHHEQEHHHHHHSHHEHIHRNLFDVNKIIDDSGISDHAKSLAKKIFMRVAKAESSVHGKPLEEVHFHEVGALDSIVDIVGTAICIDLLQPDQILSSVVNDGFGFTTCQHGIIPVPVPATAEIFAHSSVLSHQIDVEMELVTPTGAAIIAELPTQYGPRPEMKILKIGIGAGKRNSKIPNILRVFLGETEEKSKTETILVAETNLDDCTGELLGRTMEQLFQAGARETYFTPVFMKKNRPGYLLTVLYDKEKQNEIEKILFLETTTIGIRIREEKRVCLPRQIKQISTPYGQLEVKEISYQGNIIHYPEYESAKKLAEQNHVSIKEIYYSFCMNEFK